LPYRDEPVAARELRELVDLAPGPDLRVVVVTGRGARDELGAIIVRATEGIVPEPEMSMDSFRWIRPGQREIFAYRDGVTIDTSGASRFMTVAGNMLPNLGAAATDRFWLNTTRTVHTAAAPVVVCCLAAR
jgi:hypothetical protein